MTVPRIGVTGPARGGFRYWAAIAWNLRRVGANPIRLTPGRADRIEDVDGLVISGGTDIDPARYGAAGLPTVRLDPARDEFELSLLERAPSDDLPVLGICRGAQLLNVHAGGALHTDLAALTGTRVRRYVLPRLRIQVLPATRLEGILGRTALRVNAFHHQAVSRLGDSLRIAARDERGIVQAVEDRGERFRVGVQWHPELLPTAHGSRRLFAALAEAARGWRHPESASSSESA